MAMPESRPTRCKGDSTGEETSAVDCWAQAQKRRPDFSDRLWGRKELNFLRKPCACRRSEAAGGAADEALLVTDAVRKERRLLVEEVIHAEGEAGVVQPIGGAGRDIVGQKPPTV